MPIGVSRKADDIALPGSADGIHYVADDHGLGRDVGAFCMVRSRPAAGEAVSV